MSMIREIFLNIAGAETRGIWNLETGEVQILMYGGIAVESNCSKLSYVEQNITNDGFKEVKFDYLDDGARYFIQESSGKILRFAAESVIANPDGSVLINTASGVDDESVYHDLRSFCSREDVDVSQFNASQDLGSANSSFWDGPDLNLSGAASSLNESYNLDAELLEAQTALEFYVSLRRQPVNSLPHSHDDRELAAPDEENPLDNLPLETSSLCGDDYKVNPSGSLPTHCSDDESIAYV
jgi:hypothetical protein